MTLLFRFFGPPPNNQTPTEVRLPLAHLNSEDKRVILMIENKINMLVQGRLHMEIEGDDR